MDAIEGSVSHESVSAMKKTLLVCVFAVELVSISAAAAEATPAAVDAFDYFANNWNVVGLKDYQRGARVTPDNRILLDGPAQVRVRFGRGLTPLGRQHGKLAREGWMPILEIAATDGPVRYEFTYWATPLPSAKDWQQAFDWPTEGENFLVWVGYRAINQSDEPAVARLQIRPSSAALPGGCSREEELPARGTLEGTARFAFFPVEPEAAAAFETEDAALWLRRTVDYWQTLADSAARIRVPCRKASDALKAAHVCQMIANDHGEVRGGEGFYDQFYIRDGAYQVLELEEAGMWDAARKSVELYLPRQRPDGRFESQRGQFDANGQAVWVLWQYHKITGDRAWLERVYPAMRKAVDWTIQARRQAPADSPFAGLLPNALADGEFLWNGKQHIVGYDFWNLRGMLCAADAARILGRTGEADELTQEANRYREAIEAAWKRTGLAHFPPSWETVGTHWGNTETLWPTAIFAPEDARVAALSRFVRREFAGGFVEGTIRWVGHAEPVIHPYMGAYTTMADLVRGNDEQVVEDFYWYLLHSTAAHAFPEGIYPERRYAWSETIPHVTGACNYAILLRHMLVHEAGDELHLLTAVPDGWLGEGQEIHVERLPTHFGEMDFQVYGTAEGVEVKLKPPTRNPPARIVLRLPQSRPLAEALPGVEVVTRPDQQRRWDFPAVVELYAQSAPPEVCPRPDMPSLTTGKPAECSSALAACPLDRANDGFAGDPRACWATDVKSQNDPRPWWQVDLEEPATIGRVVVVGYYGDQRYYGFTVEGSLDGAQWNMLADRRDNKELATKAGYSCRFAPVPVRYLRVTMTGNSANTGRHLVEVAAFKESP